MVIASVDASYLVDLVIISQSSHSGVDGVFDFRLKIAGSENRENQNIGAGKCFSYPQVGAHSRASLSQDVIYEGNLVWRIKVRFDAKALVVRFDSWSLACGSKR